MPAAADLANAYYTMKRSEAKWYHSLFFSASPQEEKNQLSPSISCM